jgi:uncharacterized membrane protein YqjE
MNCKLLKLTFNTLALIGIFLLTLIVMYETNLLVGSGTAVLASLGCKYLWFKSGG